MTATRKSAGLGVQIGLVTGLGLLLLFLAGCGSAGAAPPPSNNPSGPAATVSPTSLSFGNVSVGGSSAKTVSVTNSGNADLIVNSVTITGAAFSMSQVSFPLTINPGASYTATITFTPQSVGAATGSATIVSNVSNSPTTISFSGTGVAAAIGTLSISPATLSFGNVAVGASSTQTATVSNTGNADVVVSSLTATGNGFSTNLSTPFTLTAGSSTPLSIIFSPQATGAVNGTATLASNASNTSTTLSYSGTGAAASSHTVGLSWAASTSTVAGYNVYRGEQSGGPYQRVNTSLQSLTGYTDSGLVSGQSYFYVVTAVDSSGNESVFSNEATAAIP